MAINFPSSPSNGDEFIDAGSGTEWVYNSADKSWTMTGAGSSSPFNFRGGYDFRTNNTISDLESGDLFIHEGADGTVGSGYVGLSGQITSGTLVLWDGDEFIKLSSSVPGYPDIDDPNYQNGTLDSRYLCLAADAGAQVVQSNDPTEFKSGIKSKDDVFVELPSGAASWALECKGAGINNSSGLFQEGDDNYTLSLRQGDGRVTRIASKGNIILDAKTGTTPFLDFALDSDVKSNIFYNETSNFLGVNSVGSADLKLGSSGTQVGIGVDPGAEALKIGGDYTYTTANNFVDNVLITPTIEGSVSNAFTSLVIAPELDSGFTAPAFRGIVVQARGDIPETVDEYYAVRVPEVASGTNLTTEVYGYWSGIGQPAGSTRYNFFSTGIAPNFYAGSTYIGGTTARNTLDLWKSTLTEEQLEQLEAGTLVAPANVSTPGDGEFARQWYYDQQDAETQAELTAGTLEYPEHLLAANFTDTFALGDNTAINLLSSGNIKCLGVEVTQLSASLVRTQNFDSLDRDNLSSFGFNPSPTGPTINFQAKPWGVTDENTLCSGIGVAMYQSTSSTVRGDVANFYAFPAEDIALTKSDGIYSGFYGLIDKSINGGEAAACFTAENVSVSDGSSTGTNAGFYSKLITANPNNYNFYAAGNAPNYFAGNIDCDGLINGAFSLRMQTDDPDAFTTTLTTDEEGNEVSNSVYNGTTEDLLSIIKDLRARVTALEAAATY